MEDRDTERVEDEDAFIEAQDGGYEPAPAPFDADDVPVDEDADEDDLVPDDERPVPLDLDDAELD